MKETNIENIFSGDILLCIIIKSSLNPVSTTFITPEDKNIQCGFVVYSENSTIKRHFHRPLQRQIIGTSEVLEVRKGRCEIDIYNDQNELIATRILNEQDIMIMLRGGHGFRMLEDTVFLEIKQGPYTGPEEKEIF